MNCFSCCYSLSIASGAFHLWLSVECQHGLCYRPSVVISNCVMFMCISLLVCLRNTEYHLVFAYLTTYFVYCTYMSICIFSVNYFVTNRHIYLYVIDMHMSVCAPIYFVIYFQSVHKLEAATH